jgi:FixJ family two-component response regulator
MELVSQAPERVGESVAFQGGLWVHAAPLRLPSFAECPARARIACSADRMAEPNASPPASKVFVVDDDAMVARALQRVLALAGFEVETSGSALEFLARPPHDGPACIVLDQKMPGMTGLELQAVLADRRDDAGLLVIFLTGHGDVPMSVLAMKAGAFDFLSKPVDGGPLVETVQRALEESMRLRGRARERSVFLDRWNHLSLRQRQVCAHVLRGLLNKEIAFELGIAEKTVKIHRAQAMGKLGLRSVAELAQIVERTGALGTPS